MVKQVVSGVGKNSSRTDKNLVERTQSIQRKAKIQNAAGAPQGVRQELQSLTQGDATAQTASAVSADVQQPPVPISQTVTPVFAPGSQNLPFADGAGGNTAGRGPDALLANFNTPNAGSVLARALHLANPTPYTSRLVRQFDDQGMF
jgi:hypothetical protein